MHTMGADEGTGELIRVPELRDGTDEGLVTVYVSD